MTLPTAEAGLEFTFVLAGVADGATITCSSGDGFFGTIKVTSTTDDKTSSDEVIAFNATVGDCNVLTLDGDAATSGGQSGDMITCIAVNDTRWMVNATLTTSHSTPAAIDCIA